MADWYRRRYAERERPTERLFVQSFALVEPWWTIRTGSVPYWAAFNTESDADFLEAYLESAEPYDEIESHHPHLPPLSIDRFDSRTAAIADEYAIEWETP